MQVLLVVILYMRDAALGLVQAYYSIKLLLCHLTFRILDLDVMSLVLRFCFLNWIASNMYIWHTLDFDEISGTLMHALLRLRQDVFVIEQTCIYPDIDDYDKKSRHVFALCESSSELACYARVVWPGVKYKEPAIGRVVVSPNFRRDRLGSELIRRCLDESDTLFSGQGNRISAQEHLYEFYHALGYERVSEPYDEDGIPHIEMLRPGGQ